MPISQDAFRMAGGLPEGSHRRPLVAFALHVGWHFGRTVSAGGETVVVDVFFRRAFAEPCEAVGERQHHVARHGVELLVLNVVCRHAARHVFLLLQQVVCASVQLSPTCL